MAIVDIAVEAAKLLGANKSIVRLSEIRFKANEISGKNIKSGSFDAIVAYHTINIRLRFWNPNNKDKDQKRDWKKRPEFYCEERGWYRLLSDEEKKIFLKLVDIDHPIIYKDKPSINEIMQAAQGNKSNFSE